MKKEINELEKITNTIFLCQCKINELEKIKEKISKMDSKEIRFRIETKHWYGWDIEGHIVKERSDISISEYTMNAIIDTAIEKEREHINKLIDLEVEKRKHERLLEEAQKRGVKYKK